VYRSPYHAFMAGYLASTPLVRLQDDLFLKCEFLHPGRSHKARVARALIEDAEARGGLSPAQGRILLERTGGNLGVALAMEAQSRGYELTLVTDPQSAPVKRRLAASLGATVIDRGEAHPDAQDNGQVIRLMLAEGGSRYYYLNQFGNPANPRAHEVGTGQEIGRELRAQGYHESTLAVLVTGMGTGASMRGISTALRRWFTRIVTVAVQPPHCDLRTGQYGEHDAYGIAVGEAAPFMPVTQLDAIVAVSANQIAAAQRLLLRDYGFLAGPSSAANFAALPAARAHPACLGDPRLFITLLFDRGEDYL
jgi:cysteine synthase A